jgi:copper chaperone CopZ
MKKKIEVNGMHCGHCAAAVEKALMDLAGVKKAKADHEANEAVITLSGDVADEAIRAIHHEFFDRFTNQVIPLFIAGYGRVGKALVNMLLDNAAAIAKRSGKELEKADAANGVEFFFLRPRGP